MEKFSGLLQGSFTGSRGFNLGSILVSAPEPGLIQGHKILGEVSPCSEGSGVTFPSVSGKRAQSEEVQTFRQQLGRFWEQFGGFFP